MFIEAFFEARVSLIESFVDPRLVVITEVFSSLIDHFVDGPDLALNFRFFLHTALFCGLLPLLLWDLVAVHFRLESLLFDLDHLLMRQRFLFHYFVHLLLLAWVLRRQVSQPFCFSFFSLFWLLSQLFEYCDVFILDFFFFLPPLFVEVILLEFEFLFLL